MDTTAEQYEAPRVTSLGSLASLTLGGSTGSSLDATFPTHTPKGKLTFS